MKIQVATNYRLESFHIGVALIRSNRGGFSQQLHRLGEKKQNWLAVRKGHSTDTVTRAHPSTVTYKLVGRCVQAFKPFTFTAFLTCPPNPLLSLPPSFSHYYCCSCLTYPYGFVGSVGTNENAQTAL